MAHTDKGRKEGIFHIQPFPFNGEGGTRIGVPPGDRKKILEKSRVPSSRGRTRKEGSRAAITKRKTGIVAGRRGRIETLGTISPSQLKTILGS